MGGSVRCRAATTLLLVAGDTAGLQRGERGQGSGGKAGGVCGANLAVRSHAPLQCTLGPPNCSYTPFRAQCTNARVALGGADWLFEAAGPLAAR